MAFVKDVVSDMPDDERFRKFADHAVENNLDARCDFSPNLWLKVPISIQPLVTKWRWVTSLTFKWQLLLSSAKHLLICRDVTATTDVHIHSGVALTVTAVSQDSISATDVHCLQSTARDISAENTTCNVYHTDIAQLEYFIAPLVM